MTQQTNELRRRLDRLVVLSKDVPGGTTAVNTGLLVADAMISCVETLDAILVVLNRGDRARRLEGK